MPKITPVNKWRIIAIVTSVAMVVSLVVSFFVSQHSLDIQRSDQNSRLTNELRSKYLDVELGPFDNETHNPTVEFPGSYYTAHADKDVSQHWLYTYTDSEATGSILSITDKRFFDKPDAVAEHPECIPTIEVRSRKTDPKPYQDAAIEITVNDKTVGGKKSIAYLYSPKLGVCSDLFTDDQLLLMQQYALTLRNPYL
jgi:hypothetical protein